MSLMVRSCRGWELGAGGWQTAEQLWFAWALALEPAREQLRPVEAQVRQQASEPELWLVAAQV